MIPRNPLKKHQLPGCYGQYDYEECRLCFVATECMHKTTGQSCRQIIYLWEDLEKIKNQIYPKLIKSGIISPDVKAEHIPMISALKAFLNSI